MSQGGTWGRVRSTPRPGPNHRSKPWELPIVVALGRASDQLFEALHSHLSDEDILELTYHVMGYNLHAVCCKALRLEYDDVPERIREVPVPAAGEIADWAGKAWSE